MEKLLCAAFKSIAIRKEVDKITFYQWPVLQIKRIKIELSKNLINITIRKPRSH